MNGQIDDLLQKTSRTFALSIPLLEPPLRYQVSLAYLLFRIADTFEDADLWDIERRTDALTAFGNILNGKDDHDGLHLLCNENPPSRHLFYQELVTAIPYVIGEFNQLPAKARATVSFHLSKTIGGMAAFLKKRGISNAIIIENIGELKEYCYVVAGIVGEMLTDLFIAADDNLKSAESELMNLAVYYGEGLQLTNIIKDMRSDIKEGRIYLPKSAKFGGLIGIAEGDLQKSIVYVNIVKKYSAGKGLVKFLLLPLILAFATLDEVKLHGPGSKVSRDRVSRILLGLEPLADRRDELGERDVRFQQESS